MKKALYVALVGIIIIAFIVALIKFRQRTKDKEAMKMIDEIVAKIEPVMKESALAYWNATTTGEQKYYDEYEAKELEYRKILSDKETFGKLKELKDGRYKDSTIKREVEILYLDFLANQIPEELTKEIVKRETDLTKKFTTFRAKVDGKEMTDNEIKELLRKSVDLKEREAVWSASKQVGREVAADLIELVKLRNKAAGLLGFKDYYEMQLYMQEFTEEGLYKILDELAKFTEEPFTELKGEIDRYLAQKYGIEPQELRPWHYEDPFFQEVPKLYEVDFDKFFKGKDIVEITRRYYDSIGLNIDDIISRSDLFEKKGKEQHAYCTDIDRKGDVRILANVKDNEYWMGTMLHESGHAVYDKFQLQTTPFILREAAHIFTTEGIAELFGRLQYSPEWIAFATGITPSPEEAENLRKLLRAQMLLFARWVLVMTNFERELYKNPDQNLNALWWELVEKYQKVHGPYGRNEPDWAAKIHFSTAPVYYHNYILGEMFASQLTHYIQQNIVPPEEAYFMLSQKVGPYLKEKVFEPGRKMRWDELVKYATGEELTAKYFADQFAK